MTDCSVCLGETTKETGKTILSCGHVFHLKCIVTWLQREEGPGTCPCCRAAPTEHEQLPMSDASDASDESDDSDEESLADSSIDDEVDGVTLLMEAAIVGNIATIRELLAAGCDIHARDSDGETALFYASIFDRTEVIRILLDAGADINAKNNNGANALIRAAEELSDDAMDTLVQCGADVSVIDNNRHTALTHAISHRTLRGLRMLVEALRSVPAATGATLRGQAFLAACENKNIDAIEFLLGDANVPIDYCDADGLTGLMRLLAQGSSADCISMRLLERGARVDLFCLCLCLTGSSVGDRKEFMELLLEKAAPWLRGGDGVWRRSIQMWSSQDKGNELPSVIGQRMATDIQKTWRRFNTQRSVEAARSLLSLRIPSNE
jgi:ankyrin repeat protein